MAITKRSSGILLPVSALPSRYGIGTFGAEARKFIDFLKAAKQTYWQILPLGPTSCGNSPYSSFSTFAGNPFFIDPAILCKEGLLKKEEVESIDWGKDPEHVDYDRVIAGRAVILPIAAERGLKKYKEEFAAFCEENAGWLTNYALYMALKDHFGGASWNDWPDDEIRKHTEAGCEKYKALLKEEVEYYSFIQFLFFRQWSELKAYAHTQGIRIIGDIPIYVAMDSADVWAEPQNFQLDSDNRPVEVSGVPPDYFSEEGQLWGNPLYDWDFMERDGFGWWIRRIGGAEKLYDVVRIDHFRGFESYWSVPVTETTAKNGHWVKGPGMKVVSVISGWFHGMEFITEDLGLLTPEVKKLVKDSGFPGMKVLEFAFDETGDSDYLPHKYDANCVCYTGTHDNAPLALWKKEGDAAEIRFAKRYLAINDKEGFVWGVIRGGMSSVARLFVAEMQDYLELGVGSRTNIPGVAEGNWTWRMKSGAADRALAGKIARMAKMYGRAAE